MSYDDRIERLNSVSLYQICLQLLLPGRLAGLRRQSPIGVGTDIDKFPAQSIQTQLQGKLMLRIVLYIWRSTLQYERFDLDLSSTSLSLSYNF